MPSEHPAAEPDRSADRSTGVRDALGHGDGATPHATFLEAADAFTALCARIGRAQWHGPGLGEWSVRGLVGHTLRAVTTVTTYLSAPAPEVVTHSAADYLATLGSMSAADDAAVAARGHRAGEHLGDVPATTVGLAVTAAREALAGLGDADPMIATLVGGMRLSDYLMTRTFELTAHSLDIAAATGQAFEPPRAALEIAVTTAAAASVRQGNGAALLRQLLGRPGGAVHPVAGTG